MIDSELFRENERHLFVQLTSKFKSLSGRLELECHWQWLIYDLYQIFRSYTTTACVLNCQLKFVQPTL